MFFFKRTSINKEKPLPLLHTVYATMYSDESDEPTNPTADNVIDSTEVKRDSDEEEGRHERVTNGNTNGRGMVGDQSDDEDAGGLFGSGSEDEGTTLVDSRSVVVC